MQSCIFSQALTLSLAHQCATIRVSKTIYCTFPRVIQPCKSRTKGLIILEVWRAPFSCISLSPPGPYDPEEHGVPLHVVVPEQMQEPLLLNLNLIPHGQCFFLRERKVNRIPQR